MPFEIARVVWLEDIVEKLHWKHNVVEVEVIEVFENHPPFHRKQGALVPGEDVYAGYERTNQQRPLSIFFVYTRDKRAIIVSARDMTKKERRRYDR